MTTHSAMNRNYYVPIAVLAVVLAVAGASAYTRKKHDKRISDTIKAAEEKVEKEQEKAEVKPEKTVDEWTAQLEAEGGFPLKWGSGGDRVEQLQRYLLTRIADIDLDLEVTGIWDQKTDHAVRELLRRDNVSLARFVKGKMYDY